jgi:hypothetical protein
MKITFKNGIKISDKEFNRAFEMEQTNTRNLISGMIKRRGLIVTRNTDGSLGGNWKPTLGIPATSIQIAGGYFIGQTEDGYFSRVEMPDTIYSPDSSLLSGTYILRVQHRYVTDEIGTVNVTNNSVLITGNGTEFTKIFAINRRILINGVFYTIASVQSNTMLTLQNAFPLSTQSNLKYGVGGYFVSNYPSAVESNTIYARDSYAFSLVTSAHPAICQFTWNQSTGLISNLIDLRESNLLLPYDPYDLKTVTDNIKTENTSKFNLINSNISSLQQADLDLAENIEEIGANLSAFQLSQELQDGQQGAQINAHTQILSKMSERLLFIKDVKILTGQLTTTGTALENTPNPGFIQYPLGSASYDVGSGNGVPYTDSSINLPKEFVGSMLLDAGGYEIQLKGVRDGNKIILKNNQLPSTVNLYINKGAKGRRVYRGLAGEWQITKAIIRVKEELPSAVIFRIFQLSNEGLPLLTYTVTTNQTDFIIPINKILDVTKGDLIVDFYDSADNTNYRPFIGTVELYYIPFVGIEP